MRFLHFDRKQRKVNDDKKKQDRIADARAVLRLQRRQDRLERIIWLRAQADVLARRSE